MDLAQLTALLSQDKRLLTLDTALPGAFIAHSFTGREGINEPFHFFVDTVSVETGIDLAKVVGFPMTLRLATADGGTRYWHGYVTRAHFLGADGGLSRYRLSMESFLAFLAVRSRTQIVQDKDVLGVIEQVMGDYPEAKYRVEVTRTLRQRPITTQYRESDEAFVQRLLSEEGLSYRFEHDPGDDGQATLVIFDSKAAVPAGDPADVRVARLDASEATDALSLFSEQLQIVPDTLTAASWKADQVQSIAGSALAPPPASDAPTLPGLDVFEADRTGRFDTAAQANDFAQHQLDARRMLGHTFAGEGSVRTLEAGKNYNLTEHPGLPDLVGTAFVPLWVEHSASNANASGKASSDQAVGHRTLAHTATPMSGASYRCHFRAVPNGTPIVPRHHGRAPVTGVQSAIVVGLPDAVLTGTRDHQIRVQFAWQRGSAALPGGLTDPEHAPGNQQSGTWVRVAEPSAGAHHGAALPPRIGSEVLIQFAHGDPDMPVVIGRLYNGQQPPPFSAGENSASNHPGTLSGIQTQGVDGAGSNQWVLDDAPGQLSHRLSSSLANSQLHMGYLTDTQGANRGSYLGEGFALTTQGWSALRAGGGVLLSSSARPNASSTAMDASGATAQLKAAVATTTRLDTSATQAQAGKLAANTQTQSLLQSIDPQQDGKYPGTVNGQSATKPTGSQRDGGDPVEQLGSPIILADAPNDLLLTTPQSSNAFAGQSLHLTAQGDAHLVAGATLAGAGGGPVQVYTANGGMKMIANHGPVSLEAHTDALSILADQSVSVTSTTARIDVLAKDKIVLQAGQSTITLQGGDITFACPGNFTVKSGTHQFIGPESESPELPNLPAGQATISGNDPFTA